MPIISSLQQLWLCPHQEKKKEIKNQDLSWGLDTSPKLAVVYWGTCFPMWCYCKSVSHWHRKARVGRVDWQGFLLKYHGYGQPALAKHGNGRNCWPEDCCPQNCCLHPCSLAPINHLPSLAGRLADPLCFAEPIFYPLSRCFQFPKGCVLSLVSMFSSLGRWVEVVSCLEVLCRGGLKGSPFTT